MVKFFPQNTMKKVYITSKSESGSEELMQMLKLQVVECGQHSLFFSLSAISMEFFTPSLASCCL